MEDPAREGAAEVRRGARVAADGHQRVPRDEGSPDVRRLERTRHVEEVHRRCRVSQDIYCTAGLDERARARDASRRAEGLRHRSRATAYNNASKREACKPL